MDGVTIAKGVVLGTAAYQLIIFNLYRTVSYSQTVFVIYAVLLVVLVTVTRASFRLMGEFIQRQRSANRRAVIYGTGHNVSLALRELRDRAGTPLKVIGFVDEDRTIARTRVHGYPVLGGFEHIRALITANAVEVIILNQPLDDERVAALESLCQEYGVSLLRLHVWIEELVTTDGASPATDLRARLRHIRR
jgi:FlaA1/EpsC-like NDP-sugar epimerase